MKLAMLPFCAAFVFGQNTSPAPSASTAEPRVASVELSPAHGYRANMDILSDTHGVDFGPYLRQVIPSIKAQWYKLIPESAEHKKGKLAIEFAITKDGQLTDMRVVAPSGDAALDLAASGSIIASNPFPSLPSEFTGPNLVLRLRFYYNPNSSDVTCIQVSISPYSHLEVALRNSMEFTATVTGTTEKAVEWRVSGAGCSDSTCGVMTKGLYRAPSVLPNPPLVTLTAISIADPTAIASVTVHIIEPAPSR